MVQIKLNTNNIELIDKNFSPSEEFIRKVRKLEYEGARGGVEAGLKSQVLLQSLLYFVVFLHQLNMLQMINLGRSAAQFSKMTSRWIRKIGYILRTVEFMFEKPVWSVTQVFSLFC